MSSPKPRRRKGQGGLYTITRMAWNEHSQQEEPTLFYQATKDITDPDNPDKRKRVTGTGRSAKEAQDRLGRSLERFYRNKGLAEAGVTIRRRPRGTQRLSEYFDDWFAGIRPDKVSITLRLKYKQHFVNHILPHVGNTFITDLNYQQLTTLFYDTLPAKKKIVKGQETDQPLLGINAILNVYRTLNVALHTAVKLGLIPRNPLELVDTPRYQPPKENIPQLAHLVDHIFEEMAKHNDPLFDHFLLALLGLRKGERLGLTFSAVTLTGPSPKITIRSQLTRINGQGIVLKPATKSGKDRTVALSEPWLSSLKRIKQHRKELLKNPDFRPDESFADMVFLKVNGKPYDPNEDNEMWNAVLAKYNSKGSRIRGHALRHVAATKMADAGVSRDVAMAILGHESEAISFYYGRMSAKGQAAQLGTYGESISKRIKPQTG